MSEHTPGPWSVCADGDCPCKTVTCADHPIAKITVGLWGDEFPAIRLVGDTTMDRKAEAYMARFSYGEVDEETAKANGRLIAAAPDLLAAAREAQEFLSGLMFDKEMEGGEGMPLRKQLADAIAKAEGGSGSC